uniref:Uncharacterized protein n=1 Tax=Anguilla anguilla TaxID=7936 RepID=A0A0E9XXA0_ANGAN
MCLLFPFSYFMHYIIISITIHKVECTQYKKGIILYCV